MDNDISETAFATQVEDLLDIGQWKWMHIEPSVRQSGHWASAMNPGGKGWLDYLALRPPRILVFELKDNRTKMTPEQGEWFEMWLGCIVNILSEPLTLTGNMASINMATMAGESHIRSTPELYLWRPKQIDEIMEILS